jgi:CSLREA domain-containing protein
MRAFKALRGIDSAVWNAITGPAEMTHMSPTADPTEQEEDLGRLFKLRLGQRREPLKGVRSHPRYAPGMATVRAALAGSLSRSRAALVGLAMLIVLMIAPSVSAAATFTVNSSNDPGDGICDAGECTLREAIEAANATAGTDTIAFNVLGITPITIQPTSQLPDITDAAVIDGTTQPGFSGCSSGLAIEIGGSLAGSGADGLRVDRGPSTIRGLAINRFSGIPRAAIRLTGNGDPQAGHNTLECDNVGTDASGTVARGNNLGVNVESADNTIGGTNPAQRNIISGGRDAGVRIEDNGFGVETKQATRNVVEGNYIGTDVTGTVAMGNGFEGVFVNGPPANTVGGSAPGAGNVISGNAQSVAVAVGGFPDSGHDVIQGNLIGTTPDGVTPLGNEAGISSNAPNNTIGGSTAAERNVVAASEQFGVALFNARSAGTVVQGNYIGTDSTGTQALPNLLGGVWLGEAENTTVGGTAPGEGNVISGNGQLGVLVFGGEAAGNSIQGNLIGTKSDGVSPLGNALGGVRLRERFPHNNTIGGSASGAGNTIAFNGGSGIQADAGGFFTEAGCCNAIEANSIYANAGLGIDLGGTGVTPNDPGDADTGPNELQNFPELTSATSSGGGTTVQGMLNSTAKTTFRIEFFSSPSCDPSGFGEGKNFLGSQSVTTDAGGNATFTATVPTGTSPGESVTATATDPAGNTSEFSSCRGANAVSPTSLTTSLSGGGQSGEQITVKEGTAVTDQATLNGKNATTATGTVTYNVYSDSTCKTQVASAGTVMVSQGKVPASEAETLPQGTYYWQAAYSGDTANGASKSECGVEIEKVTESPKCQASPPKVNVRWHYSAEGSAGSWSVTREATCGKTLTMGPQAMEGALKVTPGKKIKAGYDFALPSNTKPWTVLFSEGKVVFKVQCVSGAKPSEPTFTVTLPDQSYAVTNANWYPSGNQSSPLVYQGEREVPALCGKGQLNLKEGGTFSTMMTLH